ncbi:MAG: hypothetical protein ABDH66_03645 [Bacteroidia bacterium]
MFLLSCSHRSPFEGIVEYRTSVAGEGMQALDSLLQARNTGFTLYQTKNKIRIDYEEGHLSESMIMDYGKDSVFFLFHSDSTYTSAPLIPPPQNLPSNLKQEPTSERQTIAQYSCEGQKVSYKLRESDRVVKFWEAKDLAIPHEYSDKMPLLPPGTQVNGMPLRLEISASGQPFTVVHQAISVQQKTLDENIFVVPLSYRKIQ